MSREQLRVYARSIRNLALMFGFFGGLVGLAAIPAGLTLWLVLPDFIRPYASQYPAVPVWLAFGLLLGVLAAFRYRQLYPHNPRGAGTLLTVLTGLGLLTGLGFTLLGPVGGGAALLFSMLGAASYIYMEKTAPAE